MIVLTADQRGSTRGPDRVPHALELLAAVARGREGMVLPFDRTVGDELQGLLTGTLDGASLAVDAALALLRDGGWSVGLGVGAVVEPLPTTSRAAAGPAFVHARRAVERAKSRGSGGPGAAAIAVESDDAAAAAEVEALLRLLGAVAERRSDAGWEAVDAVERAGTQKAPAAQLGVSVQAVSQRLRAGLRAEEAAVRPVVARLLAQLDA
jgi:hypothetical protein